MEQRLSEFETSTSISESNSFDLWKSRRRRRESEPFSSWYRDRSNLNFCELRRVRQTKTEKEYFEKSRSVSLLASNLSQPVLLSGDNGSAGVSAVLKRTSEH